MRPTLLVTAFGPFGGRRVNASSLALEQLCRSDRSFHYRILPVDLVEAPRRLRDALRRLSPRALLMTGEAAGAKRLRIETRAWNELDFPIPDLAGRQPRRCPIERGGPEMLPTSVPTEKLRAHLRASGHDVELSSDPGRYLCNRIYHAALQDAGVPALFIHLPLESRLAPVRAASALMQTIDRLAELSGAAGPAEGSGRRSPWGRDVGCRG